MILYDPKKTRSSPRGTPSASARCITAAWRTGRWCTPASPRTWWGWCRRSSPFHRLLRVNGEITRYADIAHVESHFDADIETLCEGIRTRLIAGVEKRLDADAPLGFS